MLADDLIILYSCDLFCTVLLRNLQRLSNCGHPLLDKIKCIYASNIQFRDRVYLQVTIIWQSCSFFSKFIRWHCKQFRTITARISEHLIVSHIKQWRYRIEPHMQWPYRCYSLSMKKPNVGGRRKPQPTRLFYIYGRRQWIRRTQLGWSIANMFDIIDSNCPMRSIRMHCICTDTYIHTHNFCERCAHARGRRKLKIRPATS